jgi:hypothetical protein
VLARISQSTIQGTWATIGLCLLASLGSEMNTVGRSDTEININTLNNSKFFGILKRQY